MLALFIAYLILTTALTHAADNALPSLAQSMEQLQLKEPETPEEFMLQLRRAESAVPQPIHENDPFKLFGEAHTKALNRYKANSQQASFLAIKNFMQDIGCAEFYDYFIALASSPLPNKTDDIFVKIPYFKKLAWQSQEITDQAFAQYIQLEYHATYPVNRLFLAAFLNTSITINHPLVASHVLFNDDIVLLKRLFHHGLDPNIYNNLYNCRSLQAAQLFLMHGADFDKQHKRYDLIDYQCGFGGSDHNSSLLALFLPYVPLDKSNQFGKKWFSSLIKEQHFFTIKTFIERVAILLQYGCHYDQEQVNRIITARDTKARTHDQRYYKIRVSQLFKQAETSRKNIVFGLHQRALTGKRFGFKRAPQI